MRARETLRNAAKLIECVWGNECREAGCRAHSTAVALSALADRLDALERDVGDRRRALNNSVGLGFLRVDHGEGESQHREIGTLEAAVSRLDADLAPTPTGRAR